MITKICLTKISATMARGPVCQCRA